VKVKKLKGMYSS